MLSIWTRKVLDRFKLLFSISTALGLSLCSFRRILNSYDWSFSFCSLVSYTWWNMSNVFRPFDFQMRATSSYLKSWLNQTEVKRTDELNREKAISLFHTKISTPISTQEKTAGKNFRQNIAGEQVHITSAAPPAGRFETSWRVVCWGSGTNNVNTTVEVCLRRQLSPSPHRPASQRPH